MKKIIGLILSLVVIFGFVIPSIAAPMPVISFYSFQPDDTPYHYYTFGDEIFFIVRYDNILKSSGYNLERLPDGAVSDGWLRDTMPINGTYQLVNARYKVDTLNKTNFSNVNQDMLLKVTVDGQNGPAIFDGKNNIITLYMKSKVNLIAPEMDVSVTSLGYTYFQGPVWWSLTNDITEKEKLAKQFSDGDSYQLRDNESYDAFSDSFNSSMENKADLSKETWLTVCGGTIGGYFKPVFEQYKLVCRTDDNPILKQPSITPRSVEFDKRLLYQENVVFNFTDYTIKPTYIFIDEKKAPQNAVSVNDFMCVVSREYLASLPTGSTISLTIQFDDGSKDIVNINTKDTTAIVYKSVFIDVETNTTAWEFVNPLVEKGIIDNSGGVYRPNDAVTYSEFQNMLEKNGAKFKKPRPTTDTITMAEAKKLLFDTLLSEQYSVEHKALNKMHRSQPNVNKDLTVDDFLFFDEVWPKLRDYYIIDTTDMDKTFSRAKAAEVIYRFTKLMEYADELAAYYYPMAVPSSSTVLVNNKNISFDSYNIGGNNYFKLRDLAYALNGTSKQFEVNWDEKYDAIRLISEKEYTIAGGEMTRSETSNNVAALTSSSVYLDGKAMSLTAYNIGSNNYFKLRDIAAALDFEVGYNAITKTVTIDTSKGYSAE